MTAPPNFPNVETVNDLSATAAPGDLCWVTSTEELWAHAGEGNWIHWPPQPPAPPPKTHHATASWPYCKRCGYPHEPGRCTR